MYQLPIKAKVKYQLNPDPDISADTGKKSYTYELLDKLERTFKEHPSYDGI